MNIKLNFISLSLLTFLLLSVIYNVFTYSKMRRLESESVNLREKLKAEKDSIIKANYIYIEQLKNDIGFYKKEINKAVYSIDSLSQQKRKLKIVYVEKIREIKQFTSTELNDYWRNELFN